jgi:hypothetical protein
MLQHKFTLKVNKLYRMFCKPSTNFPTGCEVLLGAGNCRIFVLGLNGMTCTVFMYRDKAYYDSKHEKHGACNVTMRRVRGTSVAVVKKFALHILSVCL